MKRLEVAVMWVTSTGMRYKGMKNEDQLSMERRKYSHAKSKKYIKWYGIYNEVNKEDCNYKIYRILLNKFI